MAEIRIGSCSQCGGDVYGHRGPWWSVVPPPPPACRRCKARPVSEVIQMARHNGRGRREVTITATCAGGFQLQRGTS